MFLFDYFIFLICSRMSSNQETNLSENWVQESNDNLFDIFSLAWKVVFMNREISSPNWFSKTERIISAISTQLSLNQKLLTELDYLSQVSENPEVLDNSKNQTKNWIERLQKEINERKEFLSQISSMIEFEEEIENASEDRLKEIDEENRMLMIIGKKT